MAPGQWKPLAILVIVFLGLVGCEGNRGDIQAKKNSDSKDAQVLMTEATEKEYARVIVQLNVPELEKLKDSLENSENSTTRAQIEQEITKRITAVADSILSQIKDTGYRLNRRYFSLPLLAIDVSPEAHRILQSSPDILSITADYLTPLN